MSLMKRKGPEEQIAKTEKDNSDTDEKSETNPAAKAEKAVDKTELADSSPFKPSLIETASHEEISTAAGQHDRATLQLMEEELSTVDISERKRLFEEWKQLDSETVQQVIRIRRMVRQLNDPKPEQQASTSSSSGIITPKYETPSFASPAIEQAGATKTASLDTTGPGGIPFADPSVRPVAAVEQSTTQDAAGTGRTSFGHTITSGPIEFGRRLFGRGSEQPAPQSNPNVQQTAAIPNEMSDAKMAVMPAIDLNASGTAGPFGWDTQLEQLIATTETKTLELRDQLQSEGAATAEQTEALRQEYLQAQVQLRMLYLMSGNQARAVQAIPDADPNQQAFWQQTMWGLSNYFDSRTMPDYSDRATQTISQLRSASMKLQEDARLELRNLAFCHKITSFGNYERFDRDEYSPGQRVLLYVEVANFKSDPQPSDGMYRTQLKSKIEIFRAGDDGPLVHEIDFPETVDTCKSHRQDYFHSYELKIPPKLALGPHLLKITVKDSLSGKLATDSVKFTVR
ncbi:hypothetical protein V22_06030 [Calycomorphotria hydatis]|uniref:Uncharacterized protein n=2 Tax=Calycomorphotria hydatis TaxID=2528027 RepID=A0A517T4S6_9PLAN|nr:hypothetical protein V22_06030 [Calycomorphotria hydatis]